MNCSSSACRAVKPRRCNTCSSRSAKAGNVPNLDKGFGRREIKAVAVIGAGTMGGGIAMNFLNVGLPVVLLEMSQEALDRGRRDSPQLREHGVEGQADLNRKSSSAWRGSCRRCLTMI